PISWISNCASNKWEAAMLISMVVAAVLFCVAVAILADACHPILELHLRNACSEAGQSSPQGGAHEGTFGPLGDPICALSDEDRDGFTLVWQSVLRQFDANPKVAIRKADLLMADLIEDYGQTVG